MFGLTRWTNIYFPRRQLFWGDAIGGALSPIFGYHIVDLEVSTKKAGGDDFFTHTAYWDVDRKPDTYQAPHIVTLRKAVDLADTGAAIDLVDEGADPRKHEADNAYATASLAFSARLRSLASRNFLRRRIDFGVTSTSSSSSI